MRLTVIFIRGIPEGEKSAKSIRFAGRDQIFGLKRKVKLRRSRTKRIDFHGAKRKVWCIRDSAPEAGSAGILFLNMFLTMNACMMIKFCSGDWCLCRIYQPFCAVPHTSVTDFSWLQSEIRRETLVDPSLSLFQWFGSIKCLNQVWLKLFRELFLCARSLRLLQIRMQNAACSTDNAIVSPLSAPK